MPRSFLVKKYLKQKYDEDQIKLQQQQREKDEQEQQRLLSALRTSDHIIKGSILNDVDNKYNIQVGDDDVFINNNNNNSINKGSSPYQDNSHIATSLVSSSSRLSTHMQPLDARLNNGYIHDLSRFHQSKIAESNDSGAMIPRNENEVAARENFQPRRSVIVTNNNHPSNRYHGSSGDYRGYENIHSPSLPTENEQNAPYDYSIRRDERPPVAHAPPSPKRYILSTSSSPSPVQPASPMSSHQYLPSPPPAHQGIDSDYLSQHSPRRTTPPPPAAAPPAREVLPADHPFNHPLIQQLINQRLHVPGESSDNFSNSSVSNKSSTSSMSDESSNTNYHHHSRHYYHYGQEAIREDEVKESISPAHSTYSLTSPPHKSESSSPDYHFYSSNSQAPPQPSSPAPSSSSSSSPMYPISLNSSHLPPLQSYPHPHSFPPSPSPTIPSSSPSLPNSETKSYFILPPPSPPTSTDVSITTACPTPETPPMPYSPDGPEPPTAANSNSNTPNSYTYEAFLISDGRSRKRSFDQTEDIKVPGGRLRYTCNECGKDYATSSNLSRHKQTHRALDSKNAKKCPHCDKVYVSMPALSMHILTHDLKHACEMCGKTFSRPWLLQGHMRSHTGEKPFGCAHCGKAFADRSNLRAHMQTHSAFKHFACTKCNKTFALKSYLNKHLESSCVKTE